MTEDLIKTNRLPENVVEEAESFICYYRYYYCRFVMLSCIVTVTLPGLYKIIGLAALFYLLFLTSTARIVRHSESCWQNQVLGSALSVAMLFAAWYLDVEKVYFQVIGHYPDFDAEHYAFLFSLTPVILASFCGLEQIERAFYRSKGFDYTGYLGGI